MNRPIPLLLLAAVALTACASSAPPPSLEPTTGTSVETTTMVEVVDPARIGALGPDGSFTPSVSGDVGDAGECWPLDVPPEGPGERTLVLSVPNRNDPIRNVAVTLDADGRPVSYSDLRGDLRLNATGARTSISLDLRGEFGGDVTDVSADGTRRTYQVDPDEALERADLGSPARTIERIRELCGA